VEDATTLSWSSAAVSEWVFYEYCEFRNTIDATLINPSYIKDDCRIKFLLFHIVQELQLTYLH